MPSAFQKFNAFSLAPYEGKHDLKSDTIRVMLSNVAPVAQNSVKADLTEIAAGNGYVAGGPVVANTDATQTNGVMVFVGDDVVITASGGVVGPFRYATLYNEAAANDDLIGFYDYGSSISLNDGESLTVDFPANIFTHS